jgi:uncharacterized protein involved in type VI secretion and phage assembly
MGGPFYGKYRGLVTSRNDPLLLGRIQARVPDLLSEEPTGWAMPCMPFAFFPIPPEGAGVWIEFEHGDPDFPIWSGCWWGSRPEVPTQAAAPPATLVLQTTGGSSLLIDDTPGVGSISLTTSAGQRITLSATGIEIDNGSGATITMQGPSVSMNGGALEVT